MDASRRFLYTHPLQLSVDSLTRDGYNIETLETRLPFYALLRPVGDLKSNKFKASYF